MTIDGSVLGFIYGFICTLTSGTIVIFLLYILRKYCLRMNASHPNEPSHNVHRHNRITNNHPYSMVDQDTTNRLADPQTNLRGSLTDIIYHRQLDLPPTYADSMENSRTSSMRSVHDTSNRGSSQVLSSNHNNGCASPPTYEEALSDAANRTPSQSNRRNNDARVDSE